MIGNCSSLVEIVGDITTLFIPVLQPLDQNCFYYPMGSYFVNILGSVLKRPTVAITNEQPTLPPLPSITTTTNIDSIKSNRLFKIETLNPFQNK
jgi:hypothetical protein